MNKTKAEQFRKDFAALRKRPKAWLATSVDDLRSSAKLFTRADFLDLVDAWAFLEAHPHYAPTKKKVLKSAMRRVHREAKAENSRFQLQKKNGRPTQSGRNLTNHRN